MKSGRWHAIGLFFLIKYSSESCSSSFTPVRTVELVSLQCTSLPFSFLFLNYLQFVLSKCAKGKKDVALILDPSFYCTCENVAQ